MPESFEPEGARYYRRFWLAAAAFVGFWLLGLLTVILWPERAGH